VIMKMQYLILMSKCDFLLLSLATPCHYESLDQKVYEFNKRVFDKFRDVEKVKISMNSNFTQNGRLRKHLYCLSASGLLASSIALSSSVRVTGIRRC
jgi:hypothetical protein